MLEYGSDESMTAEIDALDILDSGFYEQGGEYEDLDDLAEIDSDDSGFVTR